MTSATLGVQPDAKGQQKTDRVLVFAKAPVAGLAKTRLIPVIGAEGAARFQAALIEQTLRCCVEAAATKVELWCTPAARQPYFLHCADRFGVELRLQRGGDLGERMFHALRSSLRTSRAAVLVGTDAPTLAPADLHGAFQALHSASDAVLVPAFDGGYVGIGLSRIDPALFRGVDWGTSRVMEQTRERLRMLNYAWTELPPHHDIDRPDDWMQLIEQQPAWRNRVISPLTD